MCAHHTTPHHTTPHHTTPHHTTPHHTTPHHTTPHHTTPHPHPHHTHTHTHTHKRAHTHDKTTAHDRSTTPFATHEARVVSSSANWKRHVPWIAATLDICIVRTQVHGGTCTHTHVAREHTRGTCTGPHEINARTAGDAAASVDACNSDNDAYHKPSLRRAHTQATQRTASAQRRP
jgi:hypothetical protein